MSDIVIGAAARTALNSLRNITDQMSVVQRRLATGRRINTALDGPAAYFTASALQARAATLSGLADGITNAKQTVQAANNGIAAIESLLATAKSLANQALQSADTLVEVTGDHSTALTTGTQIASTSGSASLFQAGDQITVSDGTTTATYTAADGDTVQDFLDAVNNTANLEVEASLDGNGQIVLTATDTVDVTVGATVGGSGTLNSVIGLTAATTSFEANTTRLSLASQFNDILTQIDQLAQDAGYNGTNLLAGGSLSVLFNEAGTSSLTITGGDFSSSDLGVTAVTGDFQTDAEIDAAISAVNTALNSVESQSTVLSSNALVIATRREFTNNTISILNNGADDLLATDINEDAAQLLALQTRQQLSLTVLSLTQSQGQGALRILGQ
jgi:flagellin-like hook-associated protein FlgL